MKAALQPLRLEFCLLKDRWIRQEVDLRSRLLRFSDHRKKTVLQLNDRMPFLIFIIIYFSISGNFDLHPFRQSVYNRRTDAVKSAAGLIGIVVEFSARVKS